VEKGSGMGIGGFTRILTKVDGECRCGEFLSMRERVECCIARLYPHI
jgi:hypothetical protein